MAGPDQNIQIGADATTAVNELGAFERELAKQVEAMEKVISVAQRYNSTGDITDRTIAALTKDGRILTLQYQDVNGVMVKTAETLSKAARAAGTFESKVKKAGTAQKDFAAAQAAVRAGLGRQFSQLPDDATGQSVEALEREKARLARLVSGKRIKGGAEAAIADALAQALGGVFSDDKGILGDIQRQVFDIVQARTRVGASSPSLQAAERAAEVSIPILRTEAEVADQARIALAQLEAARRRNNDAIGFRSVVREQLGFRANRPNLPAFAAAEKSFNTLRSQLEEGTIEVDRALQLFEDLQNKREVTLNGRDERIAFSAMQQLTSQQEVYNRLLSETIAKRAAINKARSERQAAGQLGTDAQALSGLLRDDLNLDSNKLKAAEANRLNTLLASVKQTVSSGSIGADRVLELYDQLKRKQDVVFAGPKDRTIAGALSQLINLQERYNNALAKGSQNGAFDAAARARVADKLQASLVQRFGGIDANASQPQIQRIQAASNALNQLVRTSNISKAQFKAALAAFEANANVHLTGVEGKAVKAFRTLSTAVNTAKTPLEEFQERIKFLGLTWENLTKLFAVQVIHSAIARIISGLTQAVSTASQFNIKISEIRTLTEGNAISASTWEQELRKVSDAFGIDLLDTAAAAYDILSNQVAKGTNAIAFLSEAAIFSKVTVSSLQDSVNLLSASVNAYRNQGLSARRASEILFSTIDLGKVRVEEIADTFGNVAILGAQVGVSFEDLNAIFAAITIQGTRSDTAMTLLNNIMLKMLKPTGEIRKLMDEWGVSTGKQAFATFGAIGVLQKFNKAIEEGKIALEDANETRAIRGFAATTSDSGLEIVQENIRKQKEAAENLERASKITQESAGAQFKKQLVEFSNFLTQDVGTKIFETFVSISQSMGGIKNILVALTTGLRGPIDVIRTLTNGVAGLLNLVKSIPGSGSAGTVIGTGVSALLGGVLTGFLTMKTVALVTTVATSKFVASFVSGLALVGERAGIIGKIKAGFDLLTNSLGLAGGAATVFKASFGGIVIALGAVIGALTVMQARAAEARVELIQLNKVNIDSLNQSIFEARSKGFEKFIAIEKAKLEERSRVILQQNATMTSALKKSVSELTENEKRQLDLIGNTSYGAKVSLDFLVNGKSNDAESELKNIADGIKKSIDATIELEQRLAKIQFDSSLTGVDTFGQTDLVLSRIAVLKESIATLFDARNMDGVRNAFKEINSLIKEQLIGPDSLDALIAKTKEQLELLDTKGSSKNTRKIAEAAEAKGLQLLDLGNIKAANAEFAKADRLFDQLNNKAESTNDKLRKLGVNVKSPTGDDKQRLSTRLKGFEQAKAETNPEDLLKQFVDTELKVEQLFQRQQAQRLADNATQLAIINESNKKIEDQKGGLEQQGKVLKDNLETQNQTLAVINAQINSIQVLSNTLNDEGGSFLNLLGGSRNNTFLKENEDKLAELLAVQKQIQESRATVDTLTKAFDKDQNPQTLKALNSAAATLDSQLKAALQKALEFKPLFEGIAAGGLGEGFSGVGLDDKNTKFNLTEEERQKRIKARDDAVKALNPDLNKVNRNGSNIEDAFRQLESLLPQFQKQAEALKQAQESLIPTENNGYFKFLEETKKRIRELNEEVGRFLEANKQLKQDISQNPRLQPNQLGQSRFATGITNSQQVAQAPQPTSNQVNVGDVNVTVQEVVDSKIDPVELGNALRRAIRQGLIQLG